MSLPTVDEVVDSYAAYLGARYPDSLRPFDQRRNADREGAVAEAIVFRILQTFGLRPEVNEVPGTGGADFLCSATGGSALAVMRQSTPESSFLVEATSLEPDAVSLRSHLPNESPVQGSGGAFALLTAAVFAKAKNKATQLANYPMPRVLAIVSSHEHIGALFNTYAAEEVLVSNHYWRQEIGSNVIDSNRYTDLTRSVFMKPGPDGTIVAARKSISAILLVAVHCDQSVIYGILHPEPAYPLNRWFLSAIPFIRIASWPIVDGRITTEWVVANPKGLTLLHASVSIPKVTSIVPEAV